MAQHVEVSSCDHPGHTRCSPARALAPARRRLCLIVSAGFILSLASCSATPKTRVTAAPIALALKATMPVMPLPPAVRFERMGDEIPLTSAEYNPTALADRLDADAKAAVGAALATVVNCDSKGEPGEVQLCGELAQQVPLLANGIVRDEVRPLLDRAAALRTGVLLLASSLVAKVGPPGYYNSMTGQVAAASNRAVLRAALIDCTTKKIVWKNDVVLRDVPRPHGEQFDASVKLLFGGAGADGE